MEEFKLTPQTQGIIENAKNLAKHLNRDGVDVDIFFHEFIRKPNNFAKQLFDKFNLYTALEQSSSFFLSKKKPNKKTSTHLKQDLLSLLEAARQISFDSFKLDYTPPESVLLAFFGDNPPKTVLEFRKSNPNSFNDFFQVLVREATVFCTDYIVDEIVLPSQEEELPEDWIDMLEDNPILSKFAENLNLKAANNEFDEIVDFDKKIEEMAIILCRKKKPNVILIGEAGCGKSSLVEALATKIVKGEAPELLANKVIYSLNLSSMVAGTEYRGQFEKRLEDFVNEVKKYSNLIIFIDEIHTLIGAGGGSNSALEASNILKPELARGTISCIGATTIDEYKMTIKRDSALDRRFEKVFVRQPSKFQMQEILPVIFSHYEEFHGVVYEDEFKNSLLDFCENYLPNKTYPDKAIDVIDQCAAKAKVDFWRLDKSISDPHFKRLEESDPSLHESIYEEFKQQILDWFDSNPNKIASVKLEHLKSFIDKKIHIFSKSQSIEKIFSNLPKKIVGSRSTLNKLKESLNLSNLFFNGTAEKHIKNVFLFNGVEGCGKSFFASSLAEEIDRNGGDVIMFNGSFFSEPHHRFRIICDDPSKNSISERVKISQNCSIFIDDFDSVDSFSLDIFSEIFKNGKLESESGEIIDFSNCKFFLFANSKKEKSMGFVENKSAVNHKFAEWKTISNCNVFSMPALTDRDLRRVFYNNLKQLQSNLRLRDLDLCFDFDFLKKSVSGLKNKNAKNIISYLNNDVLKEVSRQSLIGNKIILSSSKNP